MTRVVQIRRIANVINGGTPTADGRYWGGDVPWVTPKDLSRASTSFIAETERTLTDEGVQSGSTLAKSGSIVLSTRAPIGLLGILTQDSSFNQGCKVLELRNGEGCSQYLFYVLESMIPALKRLGQGSTFTELSSTELAAVKIPWPSTSDQEAYVRFLDRETTQIDELIAKQEQLLYLLSERRQSFITQILATDVDEKVLDSNVYWLGDIPRTWSLRKFGQVVRIQEGPVDPRNEHYNQWLLLAPNHIQKVTGRILAVETAFEQGASSGKYIAKKGTVLYSKIRPRLRKAALAPETCLISADMYSLDADPTLLRNEFLLLLVLSDQFSRFTAVSSERVAMPKINRETLSQAFVWFPSLQRQDLILRAVAKNNHRADTLSQKATEMIALLKERRRALISAAVTGKIDVTGKV